MASVDDEEQNEVPLESLSKEELIEIISRASSKLKTYWSRENKVETDFAALYDEYDSLSASHDLLEKQVFELKSENLSLIKENDSLKVSNSDLIKKLQRIESQPFISLNDDKIEELTIERDALISGLLFLEQI